MVPRQLVAFSVESIVVGDLLLGQFVSEPLRAPVRFSGGSTPNRGVCDGTACSAAARDSLVGNIAAFYARRTHAPVAHLAGLGIERHRPR